SLDVTRKMTRLELTQRPAVRIGPHGDHTTIWQRIADDAAVMLCAETVGVCERAFQLGVDYAKQRVQFGRPIASFQAIKHKIVDMLHATELARVGTHYAAWTSDVDDPHRETAAAMAKGYAGEAAVFVTAEDIQIHGGVGFTWDADPHLFYRRAKANDVLVGAHHLARVVDAEQAHHPLELLPGRGLVEVAEVLGFDALLAEQVARTSALRAVGVEVHEDVVLRIHGHEPKEARLRSRPGAAGA